MSLIFNPVWKDGPMTCSVTHRIAFATASAANAYHAKNSPRTSIIKLWHCDFCQQYHYTATASSPSGDSSGTGRGSKHGRNQFEAMKEAVK